MNKLEIPEFKTYEEEAAFWGNLDTAPFMEDDGEWFRFETPSKRAIGVAILPDVADEGEFDAAEDIRQIREGRAEWLSK